MCNSFKFKTAASELIELFDTLGHPLAHPEGLPNIEPRDAVRITETAPIIRAGAEGLELVQRRWSWPGPGGKPVYNFRSEGRRFGAGRCLIPVEGFYEFTDAEPGEKRKTRWMFSMPAYPIFFIAGLWRPSPVGEAWTMLTTEPGPDVAPFHLRQVVVTTPEEGLRWLDPASPESETLHPAPAGALHADRAPSP